MQAEPILIGSGAMQELQNRVERVETRVVEVVREVVKEEGGASESQLAELKEYVDEKVAGAGGEEKSGSAVSGIEPDGYWQPLAVNRYRFSKTFWKEVMGEEVEEVPEQKCIIWASYLGISLTFPDLVLPSGRTADWDGIEELWGALYKDGNYDEPLVPFRGPLPGTLIQSPNEVAVKGKTDTETGCYLTEKYVEDPNEINYEALWLHVSSTATKLGRLCFPLIELYPDSTLKREVLSMRQGIQTLGIGSTWTEDWVQVGQGETSLKDENRNPITAKLYTNSRKQLSMVLDGLFYSESGGWNMLCRSSLFTDVPVRYHPYSWEELFVHMYEVGQFSVKDEYDERGEYQCTVILCDSAFEFSGCRLPRLIFPTIEYAGDSGSSSATDSVPWIQLASGVVKLTDEKDEVFHLPAFLLTDGNGRLAISVPEQTSVHDGLKFDYSNLLKAVKWEWNREFGRNLSREDTRLIVSEVSDSGCFLYRQKDELVGGAPAPPVWTEDPWLNEDYLAVPPEGVERIGTLILKHIKYNGTSNEQYDKLVSESEGNNWSVGCTPKVVIELPEKLGEVQLSESDNTIVGEVWTDEFGNVSLHYPKALSQTEAELTETVEVPLNLLQAMSDWYIFVSRSYRASVEGPPNENGYYIRDNYEDGQYQSSTLVLPAGCSGKVGVVKFPTIKLSAEHRDLA